jgi:hypothetical protein
MPIKAQGQKPSERPTFKVGDRVRVRLGLQESLGTIVEDRGWLGSGGRHLFRIKVEFDSPNTVFMELPEEELVAVS